MSGCGPRQIYHSSLMAIAFGNSVGDRATVNGKEWEIVSLGLAAD
ncbi:hypothetical protein [Mesorhizobium sp. ZC-5]|nr:hypothetical protein [Mesorhizobium sp. ZC-5]MCV3239970.1 hypothetical protein [Mesorhizobium sp. ZC-5]